MKGRVEWKGSAPYALCLSHDVDRISKQWYHYLFYSRFGLKEQVISFKQKSRGYEPYYNFYKIAELEMTYGAKSTFLFLNESHKELSTNFIGRYSIRDEKVISVIKWLDSQGFDIGLHGSYYSYNNEELLRHEKKVLEEILGHEVVSTRQHFLNKDATTFEIQNRIGLKYDSTIGNKNTTGENFPIFPYYTDEGIMEMCITVMDTVHMRSEEESEFVVKACMDVASKGGLVMLNFHQRQLCNPEYPYILKTYIKLLELAKCDGAWITNMREVGEYLDARIGKE